MIIMLLMGALLPLTAKNRAQQVIAHRGYWKTSGSAQNSLAALYNAHNIGVYGSEFDVHITRDGVVVFHDDIEDVKIEDANYADIKNKRLSNGETLPTLAAYLAAAQSLGHTRLILEVKEHAKKSDEDRCVDAILRQVAKAHLADRVEYISFIKHACDYLLANAPKGVKVSYLNGDLTPKQAQEAGYAGIDYEDQVWRAHPTWIKEAKQLGLITNVWTVDKTSDLKWFLAKGIGFVTTNEPVKAKAL